MAKQAWQITAKNKLELVDLKESIPTPGSKQALVRIKAASLNYRDVLIAQHSPDYPVQAKKGLVPGSDGAGIVEEAGSGSKWKKADRVFLQANTWQTGSDPRDFILHETLGGGDTDGTLRRWAVVDDNRLVKAPEGMSLEEACTIYTAGVTAWHALQFGHIKLEPGMTVLTQGTGGVSCYAIQIAAAAGATVIATSSSDEKLKVAKDLGATHVINYRKTPDWAAEALKLTDGKGVDIVVDVVGAESIEQALKATRHGGAVEVLGMLSKDPNQAVNIVPLILFGAKTVHGILGAGSREMSEGMSAFLEKHQIHPPIAQTYPFEEFDKALEALKTLSAPGKIVIQI